MQPICQIMNTKLQQAGENTKQAAYDILSNVHEWGKSICRKLSLPSWVVNECNNSNSFEYSLGHDRAQMKYFKMVFTKEQTIYSKIKTLISFLLSSRFCRNIKYKWAYSSNPADFQIAS